MKTLDNLIDIYTIVQSGFHGGNNSVGDVCEAGEAIKNFHAQEVKDAESLGMKNGETDERVRIIELLDDEAFESEDGTKISLFINWEEAKMAITNTKNKHDRDIHWWCKK